MLNGDEHTARVCESFGEQPIRRNRKDSLISPGQLPKQDCSSPLKDTVERQTHPVCLMAEPFGELADDLLR